MDPDFPPEPEEIAALRELYESLSRLLKAVQKDRPYSHEVERRVLRAMHRAECVLGIA